MPSAERHGLLLERLGGAGENSTIRPPFHCDYGYNLRLGHGVFLNFGCAILDVVEVSIGDKTQIGPNVQILTADRPRNAAEREAGLEFGRPIQSGGTSGSAAARSFFSASPLATMRSLAPAAWSHGTCRRAQR